MKSMVSFLLTGLLATSGSAGAMSTAEAEQVFADRLNYLDAGKAGQDLIAEAREALKVATATATGDRQLALAAKAFRLYIVGGDYLLAKEGEDKKLRRDLFEECTRWIDVISPARIGRENQVYYMGINACRAWMVEVGTLVDALKMPSWFGGDEDAFYVGLEAGAEFLGGGIYRAAAAFMTNPEVSIIGLYRPEEALAMMEKAMATGPDPLDPVGRTGEDYCENYHYLSLARLAVGDVDGAATIIDDALFWFDIDLATMTAGEAPAGYEAETQMCARRIHQYLEDHPELGF